MTWVLLVEGIVVLLILTLGIWYIRRLERNYGRIDHEQKKATLLFLKTSIDHMEALHAGTARQIAFLKEHAEKMEADLK